MMNNNTILLLLLLMFYGCTSPPPPGAYEAVRCQLVPALLEDVQHAASSALQLPLSSCRLLGVLAAYHSSTAR